MTLIVRVVKMGIEPALSNPVTVNKKTRDRCEDAGENPSEFPPFRTLPALLVEEEMLRFTCPTGVALMVVQTGTGTVACRLVRAINADYCLSFTRRFPPGVIYHIPIRPLMVAAFITETGC